MYSFLTQMLYLYILLGQHEYRYLFQSSLRLYMTTGYDIEGHVFVVNSLTEMAAPKSNVEEIRNRVILGEYGVRNVSVQM